MKGAGLPFEGFSEEESQGIEIIDVPGGAQWKRV